MCPAVAARVFTVAVNTGPLPDEVLVREGADLLFSSMKCLSEQLLDILKPYSLTSGEA